MSEYLKVIACFIQNQIYTMGNLNKLTSILIIFLSIYYSDDSDERHHILVTELQSIIQGLYEAKLNDLKVLLCTCCNTSTLSPFEKPEDLYLEDAMESDNDSDDCSSCDTCEATFKETSSKSQCGCTDPSGK